MEEEWSLGAEDLVGQGQERAGEWFSYYSQYI